VSKTHSRLIFALMLNGAECSMPRPIIWGQGHVQTLEAETKILASRPVWTRGRKGDMQRFFTQLMKK